jgi:two-component system nitrogen regulation response regulator NtrX
MANSLDKRIVIVDDDPQVTAGLSALLEMEDWNVRVADTAKKAIVAMGEFAPDVVLLDVSLPDGSGVDVLDQIKRYSESTPVIMMSGAGTFDIVVESMRTGAETFLQKPFEYDVLRLTLDQTLRIVAREKELTALRRNNEADATRIAGASDATSKLNELIDRIASAPSPVLIGGESGTGKGVVARNIHQRSNRSKAPFVDLNCAGLSKELLESELFGHERGAFTGATTTKPGLFEVAGSGTVFLDEIGEMEVSVQARLLKAIEEKRFRRVGGVRDLHADFRLIAATNRSLEEEIAQGRFRADLFYRLNVVRISIPPLRERNEDIAVLAQVLGEKLAKELGRRPPRITERALTKLISYPWPGNVRELRNVLERAMLVSRGDDLRVEDLVLGEVRLKRESDRALEEWEVRPLDEVTEEYVRSAVKAAGGNVRKAARLLDVSPSTIYAKLKEKDPG